MKQNAETANTDMLEAFSALRRELGLILASELKSMGLGYNQMLITYFLTRSALPMNELSALSYSDPASTTRTVASLERAGLVIRKSDLRDNRRMIIALTKKGHSKVKGVLKTREKISHMIASTLTANERKMFIYLLKKVRTQLAGTK